MLPSQGGQRYLTLGDYQSRAGNIEYEDDVIYPKMLVAMSRHAMGERDDSSIWRLMLPSQGGMDLSYSLVNAIHSGVALADGYVFNCDQEPPDASGVSEDGPRTGFIVEEVESKVWRLVVHDKPGSKSYLCVEPSNDVDFVMLGTANGSATVEWDHRVSPYRKLSADDWRRATSWEIEDVSVRLCV